MIRKLNNSILFSLILIISIIIMALSLKGISGNPSESDLNTIKWREHGVFELSPERGRFALTFSIVENNSIFFTEKIARFAAPDVGITNGKYVSLFAPGLSYIIIPGYILGRIFGSAQVGTFAIISLLALSNFVLIYLISRKITSNTVAALIAGIVFLFGTPAYVYGVNLYQHHVSTFLILLSIFILTRSRRILAKLLVFFLCGLSVTIDYPNFFFMLPIGIATLIRLVNINISKNKIILEINFVKFLLILAVLVPISFLMIFQNISYGNPLRLSGSVKTAKFDIKNDLSSIKNVAVKDNDKSNAEKNVVGFFDTRNLLNGFYLHFISRDRGILTFTPIMFIGFVAIIYAYIKKIRHTTFFISILLLIILLYSLWGDPWGGWAFGSRYFVSAYALLSIFIAIILNKLKKNIYFIIFFAILLFYSISVNTIGAITTIANPPQVEILHLEKISGMIQRYSYDRGIEMLNVNNSKSFVFQEFASKYITAWNYYFIIVIPLLGVSTGLLFLLYKNTIR